MTPETSERLPRTIISSVEEVVGGALQYDCFNPVFKGASNDNGGAEPDADSIYKNNRNNQQFRSKASY